MSRSADDFFCFCVRFVFCRYAGDSSRYLLQSAPSVSAAAAGAPQPDSLRIDSGYVYSGTHEYMLVIAPGTAPLYTRPFIVYYNRSFKELSRQ